MAIIIGAATAVRFNGTDSHCIISVNWGYNPNAQRLYCIGNWEPDDDLTFYRPTQTLNLTLYAPGPTYTTTPTVTCADANDIQASVSPGSCPGGSGGGADGNWMVTSYSYSKDDANMPGQESWSLTKWKGVSSPGNSVDPTYVMRGVSEGQGTDGSGVSFSGDTTDSTTGNVSAGGFGRSDTLTIGVVGSVGGGSDQAGVTGQGSASMPYTQLYL